MSVHSLIPLGVATLLLVSCEQSFEPIASDGRTFSIYGHLDAAADTQWVRVMPLREILETGPEPIDATVTIEEIETGLIAVMTDSLSRHVPLFVEEAERYVHNFFTTMPIVSGRHYRVAATRSDGATSSGTVLIPEWTSPTLAVSHWFRNPADTTNFQLGISLGTLRGTRYLGLLLGGGSIEAGGSEFLPVVRPAAADGDAHQVQLSWLPPFVPSYVSRIEGSKVIFAIASGEPWPYDPRAEIRRLSNPAEINNIEGGFGFLGGVHTHVFPYRHCLPLERTGSCSMTFGPSAATLFVRVSSGCTGDPLPNVRVQLRGSPEVGIRPEVTNAQGIVDYPGLAPDVVHSLTLTHLPAPGEFLPARVENVVVAEAGVDTVSVEMAPRDDCGP